MRIPRSLLQENLNTINFPPLYTKDGRQYGGPMFKVSNGEMYTGATFSNQSEQLYFRQGDILYKTEKAAGFASKLRQTRYVVNLLNNNQYRNTFLIGKSRGSEDLYVDRQIIIPEKNYNKPKIPDYLDGNFLRYIVKSKYNNSYFFTTVEYYREYLRRKNGSDFKYLSMFSMGAFPWFIRANSRQDVIKINQFNINKIKQLSDFRDIERFITDYDEYYMNENEHLYTRGNELIYRDGNDYKGLYHIHPDKGPMEGPMHTSKPHKQLYLKNLKVSKEEGINNLAYLNTLKKVIKSLTINNITDSRILKTKQIQNMYKTQKQKQDEMLRLNISSYGGTNSQGGFSSGGGGY